MAVLQFNKGFKGIFLLKAVGVHPDEYMLNK